MIRVARRSLSWVEEVICDEFTSAVRDRVVDAVVPAAGKGGGLLGVGRLPPVGWTRVSRTLALFPRF